MENLANLTIQEIIERTARITAEETCRRCLAENEEKLLNVNELVDFLGVSRQYINKLTKSKKLPVYPVGSELRYSKREVLAALRRHNG